MKLLISTSLLLCLVIANAQNPKVKDDILDSSNLQTKEVIEFWSSYINASAEGFKAISSEFWNEEEILLGFNDIVLAQCMLPFYSLGDIKLYNIETEQYGFLRLDNRWTFNTGQDTLLIGDFSVLAKITSDGVRLYNQFYLTKNELESLKHGQIEYFYPKSYPINKQAIEESSILYSEISSDYGFSDLKEVKYLVANTLNEANMLISFKETMMTGDHRYAAYIISDLNMIIASIENHNHELVHSIFMPQFPEASSLFHEGLATFYGGSNGKKYHDLVRDLARFVSQAQNVDLSNPDGYNKVLPDGTNYYYTIGAIFIEHAIAKGGEEKVLKLLQHQVTDPNTSNDALFSIEKELGLSKDEIDIFLKKYLKDKS